MVCFLSIRRVSEELLKDKDSPAAVSHLFTITGQFIDHDISITAEEHVRRAMYLLFGQTVFVSCYTTNRTSLFVLLSGWLTHLMSYSCLFDRLTDAANAQISAFRNVCPSRFRPMTSSMAKRELSRCDVD